MGEAILQAETLNLPEAFAAKLRGKKVELAERDNVITIKPVQCPIESMHGMFESDGHEVDRFLERMRADKEIEYGG